MLVTIWKGMFTESLGIQKLQKLKYSLFLLQC